MNKGDLVNRMAGAAKISKVQAGRALNSLVEGITSSLKKGDRVTLVGFGTFSTSARKARTGRNPQTGQPLKIAARRVANFTAGAQLVPALSAPSGRRAHWKSVLKRNLVVEGYTQSEAQELIRLADRWCMPARLEAVRLQVHNWINFLHQYNALSPRDVRRVQVDGFERAFARTLLENVRPMLARYQFSIASSVR